MNRATSAATVQEVADDTSTTTQAISPQTAAQSAPCFQGFSAPDSNRPQLEWGTCGKAAVAAGGCALVLPVLIGAGTALARWMFGSPV